MKLTGLPYKVWRSGQRNRAKMQGIFDRRSHGWLDFFIKVKKQFI